MKKSLFNEIKLPEGVEAEINDTSVKIKGPEGENSRTFKTHKLNFEKKDNKIIIGTDKATKNEKKMINTITSHLKNMVEGVQKKFEYQLKVVSSHFPITVEKKENHLVIKNFLGEKIPRKSKINGDTEVEINKDLIIVRSTDKEHAGQTAANFESATRISNRDRRIFQDGIFIINKSGKEI